LLGYGVVYLIDPFLLQPDVHPNLKRLLKRREKALDLERLENCLQAELDAMVSSDYDESD